MKRIVAACICQTLHFQLKEGAEPQEAAAVVQEEVARYRAGLDRNCVRYRILSESTQPDGSVLLKIIKQYNQSPVGDYLTTLG